MDRISVQIKLNCRGDRSIVMKNTVDMGGENEKEWRLSDDSDVWAGFRLDESVDTITGSVFCKMRNESCRENFNLIEDRAVVIDWEGLDIPEKMTAMYMFNEWWTRPAFVERFEDLPDKTQVIFMKYADGYGCLVFVPGKRMKAYGTAGDGYGLRFVMTAHRAGIREFNEPVFVFAKARNVYQAVHKAMEKAAQLSGIKLRKDRVVPEMFKYLGWCSWDAFYKEISDEKVRQKAAELAHKKIPVRWMLMDDGWMSFNNECLSAFEPDPNKFPEGFKSLISDIKRDTKVRWMGVWHALGGYWGGIDQDSALAEEEQKYLYETPNGRLVPSPVDEKGYGFYRDWYNYLSGEGIDFTKVDGQSAVRFYFEDCIPVCEAAVNIHGALESAAARMNNCVINCMGMASENIFARPVSAVSRNSDDFVPDRKNGFAEHLIQNSYNSLYHNEIYVCDWDMFWTKHPDGIKHSLLRAVSGGPVYFSDRIGDTVPEILAPLCYSDGELALMDRSAKPSPDCIFEDPLKKGYIKLTNICSCDGKLYGGGVAVFNLTDRPCQCIISPGDIYEFDTALEYWVYDYFNGTLYRSPGCENVNISVDGQGYSWYLLMPVAGKCQALGLLNKYVSFSAILKAEYGGDFAVFVLKEGGNFGFICKEEILCVTCAGKDVTDKLSLRKDVWTLECGQTSGITVVCIRWKNKEDMDNYAGIS